MAKHVFLSFSAAFPEYQNCHVYLKHSAKDIMSIFHIFHEQNEVDVAAGKNNLTVIQCFLTNIFTFFSHDISVFFFFQTLEGRLLNI